MSADFPPLLSHHPSVTRDPFIRTLRACAHSIRICKASSTFDTRLDNPYENEARPGAMRPRRLIVDRLVQVGGVWCSIARSLQAIKQQHRWTSIGLARRMRRTTSGGGRLIHWRLRTKSVRSTTSLHTEPGGRAWEIGTIFDDQHNNHLMIYLDENKLWFSAEYLVNTLALARA